MQALHAELMYINSWVHVYDLVGVNCHTGASHIHAFKQATTSPAAQVYFQSIFDVVVVVGGYSSCRGINFTQ